MTKRALRKAKSSVAWKSWDASFAPILRLGLAVGPAPEAIVVRTARTRISFVGLFRSEGVTWRNTVTVDRRTFKVLREDLTCSMRVQS